MILIFFNIVMRINRIQMAVSLIGNKQDIKVITLQSIRTSLFHDLRQNERIAHHR